MPSLLVSCKAVGADLDSPRVSPSKASNATPSHSDPANGSNQWGSQRGMANGEW